MNEIKRNYHVFKACGYIGNDNNRNPTTQEKPLPPTGLKFKTTDEESKASKTDEDEKLRALQKDADKRGILLPTQFNRKITKQ